MDVEVPKSAVQPLGDQRPCRDALFFPTIQNNKKKAWLNPPESVVKSQIACVVKIVLCELRHGREPRSMSSLLLHVLFSLIFCNIFSEILLCLKYLSLCIVYFSTQRNTLFSLDKSWEQIISFSWSKSLFVLSVVQISGLESQFLWFQKTEQNSTLHCEKNNFFAICWKKLVFLLRNTFNSYWFTSSFFLILHW